MALLDLLRQTPDQVQSKQLQQLIAFAGEGKLTDGSRCSTELREYLSTVTSAQLAHYADQCLSSSFSDSGLALQDVVNEIGSRLGASVMHGRYRGKLRAIGHDGLWAFPNAHSIVVEVKTTDAYRIDLNIIAGYRKQLIEEGAISEIASSMLLIVGRQDTGDLEAQIRGSRHAWDLRIISVDALIRLMRIKEEVEDPLIIQRIHNILIPREFTRVDEIADILFSAAEDIKQDRLTAVEDEREELPASDGLKDAPVAFHEACIERIQSHLGFALVKRTRAQYSTPDQKICVNVSVSKEHDTDTRPNYWFAFHPHQRDILDSASDAYVAFGCGDSSRLLVIPFKTFDTWLPGLWTTEKDQRMYWHISISRNSSGLELRRKKGEGTIDLSSYIVP